MFEALLLAGHSLAAVTAFAAARAEGDYAVLSGEASPDSTRPTELAPAVGLDTVRPAKRL